MRRKIKNFVYTLSLSCIMLLAAFMLGDPISSGAMDDRMETISNSGLSMFNPGYINAVKQQTETIVRQVNSPKKGLLEQAVEYVKNKLENKVVEVRADKVIPDLKKKTGVSGDNNGALQETPLDPADLLSSMTDDTAGRAFNEALQAGSNTTLLSNGNSVNIWKENGESYFRVIDSIGRTVLGRHHLALSGSWQNKSVTGLTDLGDGKFAVIVGGERTTTSSGWRQVQVATNYYYVYPTLTTSTQYIQSLRIYDTTAGSAGQLVSTRDISSGSSSTRDYYAYSNTPTSRTQWGTQIGNLTSLGNGRYAMSVYNYSDTQQNTGTSGNSWNYVNSYIAVTDKTLNYDRYYMPFFMMGYGPSSLNKVYQLENYATGSWQYGNYSYKNQRVGKIISLGDGTFAASIYNENYDQRSGSWKAGTYIKVLDNNARALSERFFSSTTGGVTNMTSLGNGTFAVAWGNTGGLGYPPMSYTKSLQVAKFDKNMTELSKLYIAQAYSYYRDSMGTHQISNSIYDIKGVGDGGLVVGLNRTESVYNGRTVTRKADVSLKLITSGGGISDITLKGSTDGGDTNRYISQLTTLGGGKFAVVLGEQKASQGILPSTTTRVTVEQFSFRENPNSVSVNKEALPTSKTLKSAATQPATSKSGDPSKLLNKKIADDSGLIASGDSLSSRKLFAIGADMSGPGSVAGLFLGTRPKTETDKDVLAAYSAFIGNDAGSMNAMSILSQIIKNPTNDQKKMIDTISMVLTSLQYAAKGSENTGDLAKSAEDFAQIAAMALVSQALPDLLSTNDVSAVKNIFSHLGNVNSKAMLQYQESTKPYYEEVKKALTQNVDALQQQNILSKSINKTELDKLSRSEIDRIIEKIRHSEKKTFEVEYILQQESKYKQRYVEPNKKLLEENIKSILNDFTRKLNSALNSEKR